jgi:hypothetical protein
MDYLLETAERVLPELRKCVRGDNTKPKRELKAIVEACRRLFDARAERRRTQAQSRTPTRAEPTVPKDTAKSKPVPDSTWETATDATSLAVLADALARAPDHIPALLDEIGQGHFYPAYLRYLVETVVELAQRSYRSPRGGLLGWLGGFVTPREYVALVRDRCHIVAGALAETHSWSKVPAVAEVVAPPPPAPSPAPGAGHGGTLSGASMLGAQGWDQAARDLSKRASKGLKSAADDVRARLGRGSQWGAVAQCLSSSPETAAECLVRVGGPHRSRKRIFLEELRNELLADPRLVQKLVELSGAAAPFGVVFSSELDEIEASREQRLGAPPDRATRYAPARASDRALMGVALSGGGIRSATFNLGILQGLAQLELLRHVDYLSTVSGGGYIGSWLAAWIKRVRVTHTSGATITGVKAVEELLRTEPTPEPDSVDARPLRFLREYSNYLTPSPGFFSADTWAMVAIWLRNTLLNQLVLVLTLGGALLVPWCIWLGVSKVVAAEGCPGLLEGFPIAFTVSGVLLVAGAAVSGQQLRRFNLPPARRAAVCREMLGQGGVLVAIVTPVVASGWVLAAIVYQAREQFAAAGPFRARAFSEVLGLFLVCHVIVALGGQYGQCFLADRVSGVPGRLTSLFLSVWAFIIIGIAGVLGSVVGAGLVVGLGVVLGKLDASAVPPLSWHWSVFSVPAMVAVMSLMIVLKLGILGRNLYDEHREWWSRLGAWLTIVSLSWLVLFGFSIYSGYLLGLLVEAGQKKIIAAGGVGWALWTGAGVLLGKGDKTGPLRAALTDGRLRTLVVTLAPYVFIAGLLALVSTGAWWLVAGHSPLELSKEPFHCPHWTGFGESWPWLLYGTPGLFLLAFLLACRIDVNEFSMHHFYKNRLVRCYLGASRECGGAQLQRSPDPFTGFDPADEVRIADLRVRPGGPDPDMRQVIAKHPERAPSYVGPFPIINVALNLVKGDDLAWQERKAQSFAFTPLFSGYEYRAPTRQRPSRFAQQGFRSTFLYGYPPFGIGLGTAVAISGAAASPNMGYHTSPAGSFLMTMFNARLGWWMGNPRDKFNWLRSGPRRGLFYLLNELFGQTHDRSHFVNLSDGGHFENLGIYELVRRRCRYIVACDAEQDSSLAFNGLGNAIRKCRLDLGAEISVRAARIHPAAGGAYSAFHSVVGDIQYSDGEVGTLVYLKASLTGDEPADVLEYKARQQRFPHHSTLGDQFFDESQFESYRKLGYHVARTAFGVPTAEDASLETRFDFLRDYWYPASSAIEHHFSAHASQYDDLLERVRMDPRLGFMDTAFFSAKPATRGHRDEVFMGTALLDLMQRVFLDLNLEIDGAHPHNAGWMTIFRKWKDTPAVRSAWRVSKDNYGRRFQHFVDRVL